LIHLKRADYFNLVTGFIQAFYPSQFSGKIGFRSSIT
jgi:hypothetical protein